MSTGQYFIALLQNLEVSWLQPPILQGIAHSIASGTDDLMRVSRNALIRKIEEGADMIRVLASLLEDGLADERQAAPILETIAFVMEQIEKPDSTNVYHVPVRKLWNVVRKAHFKSTNVRRLEAANRIYGTLAEYAELKHDAIGKLKSLLLHPYPTVSSSG